MKYLLYAEHNYAYAMLRPLQKAIRDRGETAAWFLAGKEINPEFLAANELRLTDVRSVCQWQPHAVIAPGNTIPAFIPGLKVAIFHGFNIAKSTRSDERGHFNIRGCFDLYCTQGPATTYRFKALAERHGYFSVVETGWPALDPLFTAAAPSQSKPGPVVLYCSTFTPELTSAPGLKNTLQALSQNGDYHWLVQFHPKMPPAITEQYKALQNEHLTFVETDNVIPLLQRADVMLCDTSSMIPMFLVQEKPVVTFNNQSREALPILNTLKPEDIGPALQQALTKPQPLMQRIHDYAQHIHPYRDGQSSQRVLEAINAHLAPGNPGQRKAKPKNLIRNLKERHKLGYWKPW